MNLTRTKKYARETAFFIQIGLFILFLGCAGSRINNEPEVDTFNVDDLFTETEKKESDAEKSEALRLLGLSSVEQKENGVQMATHSTPEKLEGDVNRLRLDLLNKDREITELRSELANKEVTIQSLQQSTDPQMPYQYNGSSVNRSEFRPKYNEALREFKTRNYRQAVDVFNELILSDSDNSLADNCQYWIGESYYGLAKYNQAIAEFEKVFSFHKSNKNDDAQLMLGMCYMKLGEKNQARTEFNQLVAIYPNSEYKALAKRYLGKL